MGQPVTMGRICVEVSLNTIQTTIQTISSYNLSLVIAHCRVIETDQRRYFSFVFLSTNSVNQMSLFFLLDGSLPVSQLLIYLFTVWLAQLVKVRATL